LTLCARHPFKMGGTNATFLVRLFHFLCSLPVERLYCKRPIQCLASSKILTPHPLTAGRVCFPRLWRGGGHTHWVERGWGVNILEDARHSSVLYICKYFVSLPFVSTATRVVEGAGGPEAADHQSYLNKNFCIDDNTKYQHLYTIKDCGL
jgi:hypothetical protein